jgi:hypothetical protein
MTPDRSWIKAAAGLLALVVVLGYLHDPPWMGGVTSGLRGWEEDPPGTLFRWTTGRATFFVPADATTMTVPLRAVFPGPNGTPVNVELRDDDRLLANISLTDPDAWVRPTFPLKRTAGRRRFRRIDLRISRVVGPFFLGIMTGEVVVR